LIIRSSLLDKVVYDPNFRHKYEDMDHCFQARKAGYKVLYIPDAVICHHLEVENKFAFSKALVDHVRSMTRYLVKDYARMIAMKTLRTWPELDATTGGGQ
jgi:GT2 family glycosyltransferase